ncbi:MAG: polymer-forming cytoskeletal protein [Deltaproteobacteria bacterium]|nr:polymer-forming cytoskeletal protein [Deltaproteobacteria bacterium]
MGKGEDAVTFLGKGTSFEGRLAFQGTIRIDGYFKGEIQSEGNLVVGEEGMIEGDMHVAYIAIRGEVHGNILADQRVDIQAPGKVFGNIQAPSVVIDEGVIFEGKTRMYQAKGAENEESGVVGSDEYSGRPPPTVTALYGVIKDEQTGMPIRNADVKCKGAEKGTTRTNASGYYELINLRDGKWTVKVKCKGYEKQKAKLEISSGGAHEQNFTLKARK